MKTRDILKYNDVIKNIIDNVTEVSSLVKFKFLGMLKQFEPIVNNYEMVRNELINKYGKPDNNGTIGIFLPQKEDYESDEEFNSAIKEYEDIISELNKELDKILNEDISINIKKFKAEDIMSIGIPADFLMVLYDLIEE